MNDFDNQNSSGNVKAWENIRNAERGSRNAEIANEKRGSPSVAKAMEGNAERGNNSRMRQFVPHSAFRVPSSSLSPEYEGSAPMFIYVYLDGESWRF